MSTFQANAARWDIPPSEYRVVLGMPTQDVPEELQHTLDILIGNESEINNWGAFALKAAPIILNIGTNLN
ncbi:MAG: hypothetical protein ISR89_07595 [Candidatus Marinimicrobia bacterium]|nr:hypothetical protein [Candidatus Neomarinimicrobiota bacterium]MBL7031012.1 hypothetical protein [Candidatus Neomarinimicrobiota bacterium]